MSKIIKVWVVVFLFSAFCSYGKAVKWKWLSGGKSVDDKSSDSWLGGRSGSTVWQQSEYSIYVFGGSVHVDGKNPKILNDLWHFDATTVTWKLVHDGKSKKGSKVPSPRQLASGCGYSSAMFVVSGGLGDKDVVVEDTWVFYFSENKWFTLTEMQIRFGNISTSDRPAGRGDAASWCFEDKLVIFGGVGKKEKLHNDLWTLELQSLSWVQAKSSLKIPKDEHFQTFLSYPASRAGASTWISQGNLYLFGGNIAKQNPRSRHLNIGYASDLWKYEFESDSWTYIIGYRSSPCTHAGVYGILNHPDEKNSPGCRRRPATWVDKKGNLWLFGGDGEDNSRASISVFKPAKLLSDFWFFDVDKLKWTWKGGSQTGNVGGTYGKRDEEDQANIPGSRCEAMAWQDLHNKFYLYGGLGHDEKTMDGYLSDLWVVDVHLDEQVLVDPPHPGAVFGIIIVAVVLVVIVSVTYMCTRDKVAVGSKGTKMRVEYSRLLNDEP